MILTRKRIFWIIFSFLVYIPTSSKLGGFYPWYGLFFLLLLFCNFYLSDFRIKKQLFSLVFLSFTFSLCIVFSIYLNSSTFILNDFFEVLRILVYIQIIIFSFVYSSKIKVNEIKLFSKLLIFIELVTSILQRASMSFTTVMGMVWDTEKVWGQRSVGTLNNPNILSMWVIVFTMVIIFNSENLIAKILQKRY